MDLQSAKAAAIAAWQAAKGDGCSNAPDFHPEWTTCCNRHDADYATHTDETGKPLTRAQSDQRLLACLRAKARTWPGRWIVAPIYFAAVRAFGRNQWKNDDADI